MLTAVLFHREPCSLPSDHLNSYPSNPRSSLPDSALRGKAQAASHTHTRALSCPVLGAPFPVAASSPHCVCSPRGGSFTYSSPPGRKSHPLRAQGPERPCAPSLGGWKKGCRLGTVVPAALSTRLPTKEGTAYRRVSG